MVQFLQRENAPFFYKKPQESNKNKNKNACDTNNNLNIIYLGFSLCDSPIDLLQINIWQTQKLIKLAYYIKTIFKEQRDQAIAILHEKPTNQNTHLYHGMSIFGII